MTAAPIATITPETTDQGADTPRADAAWAPLSEAATKLRLSEDHLRRKCQQFLSPRGLAKRLRRESDGKIGWHITRNYDLRLANGPVGRGQQIPKAELDNFSDTQQQRAWERVACVKRFRELKSAEKRPQPQWVPALLAQLREQYPNLKISERSLKKWDQVYQQPADVLSLIDTRGGNTRGQADPACWDYFRSIFLDPRRPSIRLCWKRTKEYAQHHGLRWTSERTCELKLNDKIPPEVQAQWREPARYRSKYAPYIEQDAEAYPARTVWIGDHAQLDFMVAHPSTGKPVRPWLTAWMDWRTRRIVGWCMSLNPDSSTILAALRHGLLHQREANMGGPDAVWLDNGKDYDAYCFHGQTKAERQAAKKTVEQFRLDQTKAEGIFGLLNIEPHFSIPHNPNGKGRLERWFGTLHGQFDKTFRTYCGSYHGDRPENLNDILKDSRNLPAFDHARDRLSEYIAGYNAWAEHDRKDMLGWSPDAAIQAWAPDKRVFASEDALAHCLQVWGPLKVVRKNGVSIQVGGATITYGYTNHALRMYKGRRDQKVKVAYDPWDLSAVRVYDEDGRFITEAKANRTGGGFSQLTKQQVAKAHHERSQYRTKRREVAQNAHHEYLSTFEIAQQSAVREANQQADDPPLKPVHTPLDQAADDHQRQRQVEAEGEHREPISLADFAGDMPDFGDDHTGDQSSAMDQFRDLADRHRPDDDEDLDPIDLSQYPIGGADTASDEDQGDDGHVLDSLNQEGGVA
jgi:transposase InsO family protein